MPDLKINTDAVMTASTNIKQYNNQMRNNFSSVQNSINQLNSCWEGSAATAAIDKFNQIRSDYSENRYNVLDNYVNFLLQQIGEGYTQTEDANKSLADQFK